MKLLMYMIFWIIAIGIAVVSVISFKVIGFFIGMIFSIMFVAAIVFVLFMILLHVASNNKEDEDNTKTNYNNKDTREFM